MKAHIKNWLKGNVLYIAILIILSLILIFFIFPCRSVDFISYDSSYQYALTQHSLSEIWKLLPYDYSPPLYAVVLKLFCMIFGHTLYVMRILNLLIVIGMFILALFPMRRLFGAHTGVLCAVLCMCTHHVIFQLAEIRPTFPAMFIMMAVCIYGYDAYANHTRHSYIMLTVFSIMACYCHNIAMLGAIGVYGALILGKLIQRNYVDFRHLLLSGVIVAIAYVPWLLVVIHQFGNVTNHYWSSDNNLYDIINYIFLCPFDYYHSPNAVLTLILDIVTRTAIGIILFRVLYTRFKESGKLYLNGEEKKRVHMAVIVFAELIFGVLIYSLFVFTVYNFNSWRYCNILSMEWIVLFSVIFGEIFNRFITYIVIFMLIVNMIYAVYDVNEENAKSEVPQMREYFGDGEGYSFLHFHEENLGIYAYYFPKAKHYVCDDTYTVLTTWDVFNNKAVIDIDDVSNIWNYTHEVFVAKNNREIPTNGIKFKVDSDEYTEKLTSDGATIEHLETYYDPWYSELRWSLIRVTP